MSFLIDSSRFAGAGGAFAPDDIAGLVGWWEASDLTAGTITTWANKVSGGVDLSLDAGTPTRESSTGADAVYFNSTDRMSAANIFGVALIGTAPLTVIAALRNGSIGDSSRPVGFGYYSTNFDVAGFATGPSIRFEGAFIAGYSGSITADVPMLRTTQKDASNTWSERFDQVLVRSATQASDVVDDFRVGESRAEANAYIYGLLVYDSVLSGTDLTDAEDYMIGLMP